MFHCIFFILKIKKNHPDKKIIFVLGGYHITLSTVVRNILSKFDFIDYLVTNDGRQPMLDIAQGNTISKIIHGHIPSTIRFPQYKRIERMIKKRMYFQAISIFGCPNSCRFCASDRTYKTLPLDVIKKYLDEQNDIYKINHINFVDDCINPNIQRLKDICKMLIDLKSPKFDPDWYSHFYAGNLDDECIDLMRESKCMNVFIGAESFDDDILQIINKGCDSQKYVDTITKINDAGIRVRAGLIINLPGETTERFMNTVRTLKQLKRDEFSITPTTFKLYPNSHIYNYPELYGIKITYWEPEVTGQIPELVGEKIPKEWYYIEKQDMDSKTKEDIILEASTLSKTEKWEREVYKRGLFGSEVKYE